MIDLCFMLAETGFPQYRPLAQQMLESAQKCMRGRGIQFADEHSEPLPGIAALLRSDVTRENMMLKRVEMLRKYARTADHNMVLTDVDVVWQNDPSPLFDGSFDIGVVWRAGHPAMPYCGGFVMVRHGSEAAIDFITEWWFACTSMPKVLQKWWGDQLALAFLIGRQRPNTLVNVAGCRVKIFDAGDVLFQVADVNQRSNPKAMCRHYKGKAKAGLFEVHEEEKV